MIMDSIIAHNLKKHMDTLGVTPTQLSTLAGLRRGALSEILNSKNRNPSVWTMVRLADGLSSVQHPRITVDDLVSTPKTESTGE